MQTITSTSPRTSRRIAEQFAAYLSARAHRARRGALIVALTGDLGAGKTNFVRDFSRAIDVRGRITSPTFIFMRRHALRAPLGSITNLYHFDLYRVRNARDLAHLKFHEVLSDPRALVLIEWPERILRLLSRDAERVRILHGSHERERIFILP